MSNEQKTSSNFWNTVDLIGKLVSSILISGVLGYFIQKGAQEISFSIDSGKLTQSLITDLATIKKEGQLKQDIALAALDGSIGNRNRYLVANIAERIYMSKSGFSDPTAQYALQVLKLRNEPKYNEITAASISLIVSQASRSKPDSNPDSSPTMSKPPEQIKAISQIDARTFTGVVFIQFKNAQLRDVSEKIKNKLVIQGLDVPPLDQVNDNYSNSVRYFNKEDANLAVQVKAITENASGSAMDKFEILDFSKSGYKIPKGQIEVWIGS